MKGLSKSSQFCPSLFASQSEGFFYEGLNISEGLLSFTPLQIKKTSGMLWNSALPVRESGR
jgi:hypothetical protein